MNGIAEKGEEVPVMTEDTEREDGMRGNRALVPSYAHNTGVMGHIHIVKLGSVLILQRALKCVFSLSAEWNTGGNARAAKACIVKMSQQA